MKRYVVLLAVLSALVATTARAQTKVVTFDNPAPSARPGAMPATFDGMTFGPNWSWEAAWNADPTNNIYFSTPFSNTQSFGFAQPAIFVSVQVVGDLAGTLRLADDQGQTVTFQVAQTGKMYTVITGWTKPSKTVSATYTQNWNLAFDNFTYQVPTVTPPPSAGTLAATVTMTWDDNTPVAGSLTVVQIVGSNTQTILGRFPINSNGTAGGTITIDLTQPDPLSFQVLLVSPTNVQIGSPAAFQLPKLMFSAGARGISANIVLWKATGMIKSFNIGLTP